MKISIVRERRPQERRVAASPDSVKRLAGMGVEVLVESGAGAGSAFPDQAYAAAGAKVVADARAALGEGDIILKVQRPLRSGEGAVDELALMKRGAVLIGMLPAAAVSRRRRSLCPARVSPPSPWSSCRASPAPRRWTCCRRRPISRAIAPCSMPPPSSAARFPMMMTAAGTIPPARVLVMGAGVAGLQAIATARRLGAVVSATDVRLAAKEQVESLGATFLVVDLEAMKAMETAGGYAKEMGEDFARRQREHVDRGAEARSTSSSAPRSSPAGKAPVLITRAMVAAMRPGSVIVDLAVEQGGNVEGSAPAEIVASAERRCHRRPRQRALANRRSMRARSMRATCSRSSASSSTRTRSSRSTRPTRSSRRRS